MRLDSFFVSETFQSYDPTFADVFDFEAGSDCFDGLSPLGAEVLARFFVALGRAADHTTGNGFGEEGDFCLSGESEGLFWVTGDERFQGEPDHAGKFGIVDIFSVLGKRVQNGEAMVEGKSRRRGREVESDGGRGVALGEFFQDGLDGSGWGFVFAEQLDGPGADVFVGVGEKLDEFLLGIVGEAFGDVLGPEGAETFGGGF